MPTLMIRDMQLRYEWRGEGSPLVLLNGALDTIETDWQQHLPAFAARQRVLAYDHRGHGQTSNPSGAFTGYDQLADDLAALLDAFGIAQASFCGFSDGAITLLFFARRFPERVRALVLAGGQHTNDTSSLAMLERMMPERIAARQPARAAQLAALHDPHHSPGYWQTLLRAMLPMWRREPAFAPDDLAQISAPTLLIAGENDRFGSPEQQVTMRRALPHSELCIAPRAGHFVMNDQPALFQLVTRDFLSRHADV